MLRMKTCARCRHQIETSKLIKRKTIIKILQSTDDDNSFDRVYCPYYQHGEICNDAYSYACNVNDCFKDAYSCCNCTHKIYDEDSNSYCQYGYYDSETKNMYYLCPKDANTSQRKKSVISYWKCPFCNTIHIIV